MQPEAFEVRDTFPLFLFSPRSLLIFISARIGSSGLLEVYSQRERREQQGGNNQKIGVSSVSLIRVQI
jgi:hypothetical protein